MNLIAAQDAHIERILNATPYSQRNRNYGRTLLNRKEATLRASRCRYRKDVGALGLDPNQSTLTMRDAEDMARLEHHAES